MNIRDPHASEPDPRQHTRFEHADAAYLLGALAADEARAFEEHQSGCPVCASRLAALSPAVEALAAVTEPDLTELEPAYPDAADRYPGDLDSQSAAHAADDDMIRRLLAEAARRRRRRRVGVAALGGVAAAAIVALAIVIGTEPGGDRVSVVASRSMTALGPGSPVSANAALIGTGWGTEVRLDCRYTVASYPTRTDAPATYHLIVTDVDGARHELGSWTLRGGEDARFVSGTALPANDIRNIEITGADGTALLQLRP